MDYAKLDIQTLMQLYEVASPSERHKIAAVISAKQHSTA